MTALQCLRPIITRLQAAGYEMSINHASRARIACIVPQISQHRHFDPPTASQVAKPVTRSVRARRSVSVRAEEGAGSSAPAKVQRPANAPLFFTGVSEQSLSYLDGSLPGDFGFDPLV